MILKVAMEDLKIIMVHDEKEIDEAENFLIKNFTMSTVKNLFAKGGLKIDTKDNLIRANF
jgi:hypothetical protein